MIILVKLEFALLRLGRLFFHIGYRLRAHNAKKAAIRCGTVIWDSEKEKRYQLALRQIRKFREKDLLAGVGT